MAGANDRNEARQIYSKEFLLLRKRQNPCPCVSRQTRRRLQYFHIYAKHIPTRITTQRSCHNPLKPRCKRSALPLINKTTQTTSTSGSDSPKAQPRSLPTLQLPQRIGRHHKPDCFPITFGLLNVQSLNNKVDDILSLRRDHSLDLLLLVETWHDTDSVSLRRLRFSGLEVIDRPRPRLRSDTLATNHGGVAIASSPGIHLEKLLCGPQPSSFEHVCARATSRSSHCSILLIYRTGQISSLFFDELCTILDTFTTRNEPIVLAGDLNIHLERPNDPNTRSLLDILSSYGLSSQVNSATHNRGGCIDIVATRSDLPPVSVTISDPGISDHRLLRWNFSLTKPLPVYTSTVTRQ